MIPLNRSCPNCGGPLKNLTPHIWICPYCDARFMDEIEPAKPVTSEAPKPAAKPAAAPPMPAAKPAQPIKTDPNHFAIAQNAVLKYFAKNKIVDIVVGEANVRTHKKLPAARANFNMAPGERCCLIIDDTFASTAKKGVCLTEKGIYLCGKNLPATHIPWKKFIEVSLATCGYAGFRIGDVQFEFGLQTTARDKLYSVLQEVKQKASQTAPIAAFGQERSAAQYARILDAQTRYFTFIGSSGHIHVGLEAVTKSGHVYTRACETLGMSRSSNCYLLYSDALFGFAKGFAICDTGLYLLAEYGPCAGKAEHFTLTQFRDAALRTEGNRLYINEYGFYIYDGIDQIVKLLKNLHNSL